MFEVHTLSDDALKVLPLGRFRSFGVGFIEKKLSNRDITQVFPQTGEWCHNIKDALLQSIQIFLHTKVLIFPPTPQLLLDLLVQARYQ